MTPTIEATGVRKRYGDAAALDGLDLISEPGKVTALLGPNGAGKTTFVKLVATLLRMEEGTLRVAGFDVARQPRKVRQVIGLAGQYAAVEEVMTGRENLEMVAQLFGQRRGVAKSNSAAVLDRLGLTEHADRRVGGYSGGMRRRLDLGASLVASPRLLLLDEPTTGLDPRSRIELWTAIRELVRQGTDILLTTQYLNEADELADQIVVIDRGRVAAQGSPRELKRKFGQDIVAVHTADDDALSTATELLRRVGSGNPYVEPATRLVTVPVENGSEGLVDAVGLLNRHGVAVEDIGLRPATLDEVFLALTGSSADDERVDAASAPKGAV
ncbi:MULTISPECIES: ATP-binding cassette domain-containing protein [Micromonospora]|uniref:ABC-2 type transport system ATP-binding protein n=1 Tax=Micromonospora yangpuensis TaxID=683228 RepID=A0A1C6UUF6_9ACTN|nr:ATP-binding cassette domain-containing protein [Micromonospora yangpuensis]GGM24200.1 daunorubicin resistance protein DrrA family ABC transporter ATP-binding protein [Micromonospora yangpuensis]SCL57628.1 ABC-2 type transport system ATP-binding protein [Micromonospora yangpuensis]